jgi:hypothetical protein
MAVACGCQRQEHKPKAAAPGLELALLDDGREPRRPLRYPAEPPDQQRMSLKLKVGMKMEVPGSPIPPVTLPGLRLIVDLTGKRQQDSARYDFTVADADLVAADAAPPGIVAEMRKGLPTLVGASGSIVIDERGGVRELELGLPPEVGAELGQFMNAARLAIGQMAVPLPEAPIGVGAKWEVQDTVQQDGVRVRQKTYYELLALDATRAQVRTQTVQSADRQRAPLPGLPDGVTAEVLSLHGSGAGEIEIDLRRLVPGSAREEVETDVSFSVKQGQTERVMSLTSSAGLEIQPL